LSIHSDGRAVRDQAGKTVRGLRDARGITIASHGILERERRGGSFPCRFDVEGSKALPQKISSVAPDAD
jgi:hypothetical protein